jgi:hypothetical protein
MTDSSYRSTGEGYKHRVASYRVAETMISLHGEIERETRQWIKAELQDRYNELKTQFKEMTRHAEESRP